MDRSLDRPIRVPRLKAEAVLRSGGGHCLLKFSACLPDVVRLVPEAVFSGSSLVQPVDRSFLQMIWDRLDRFVLVSSA